MITDNKNNFEGLCAYFDNIQKELNDDSDYYDRFLKEPIGTSILDDIEEVQKIENKMSEFKGPESFDPTYLKLLRATSTVTTDQTFDDYNKLKTAFDENNIKQYNETAIAHAYVASIISKQLKPKKVEVKISNFDDLIFPNIDRDYRSIPEDDFFNFDTIINIKNNSKVVKDFPYNYAHIIWESNDNKIIQTITNLGDGMLHDKSNAVLYIPSLLIYDTNKIKTLNDLL